ncbi:response regulator [Luteimonas sp. RC10]|uniref:response regulator n=1 Tax=Luteimonas sp. RC10 TaxID=2587035 RepID=UPI0016097D9C|nr:response regulator [Luteimonas sp. RC10]MBB3344764.1 CheY-like chemotaxis protein [Luteimonas sp. RC10]
MGDDEGHGARAGRLRVLIVDDSRDDAELAELALRDAGVAVETRRVHSEAGLVEALEAFAPRVVLSDVNLPGFSGAEALALTRRLRPGVPVVFMTGSAYGLPGDVMPEGDALVHKDQLDRLPAALAQVLAVGDDGAE